MCAAAAAAHLACAPELLCAVPTGEPPGALGACFSASAQAHLPQDLHDDGGARRALRPQSCVVDVYVRVCSHQCDALVERRAGVGGPLGVLAR